MSQRAKVLWVIALAIFPLVALSAFTIWQQYLRDQFVIATERTNFAQATAYAAEAYVDGNLAAVHALAKHPALARARPGPEFDEFLKQVAADNPDWQALAVVDAEGRTLAGAMTAAQIDLGDRPYLRQALASGKAVVSPAVQRGGKVAVVIAVPLDSRQGAIVVPVPTERFAGNLLAKIGSPLLDLAVIDSEKQAFIRSDAAGAADLPKVAGPQVDAVLAGKTGADIAPFRDRASLVAYAPVSDYGWGVLLTEPTVTAFALARRQVLERSAVLAVILAVIGALGWTLAGRLSAAFQSALQARSESEHLSQDLKRALRARDEFLAAASHDLRNPLSTIQSAAELLERSTEPGSSNHDRVVSCADHILSAARRMAQQLDAFLDVSRLEAGRPLELKKKKWDLMPLVRQVVQENEQTTPRHRILLEGPAMLIASVDASRLQRVVGNLIGNAIKYSPDGGEVNVRLEAADTDVVLTVKDRGIGIPAQDQSRVFERFQRGTNVEGRFTGTGIGLAGARQIVEQHGGTISVRSQVGKGSTFVVRLPAGAEPAKAQAA